MAAEPVRRARLVVEAVDPLSRAGIVHHIASRPDLEVLTSDRVDEADLVVFVAPILNASVMARLRVLATESQCRLVLVLDQLGDIHLMSAVEIGVVGILWRSEATPERFTQMILDVTDGSYSFPPEVQTKLVTDLASLQRDVLTPLGLSPSGLDAREINVLRLIAEGLDTSEIAQRVRYSERTVKAILSGAMTRLHLRSRSEAVAYAMRAGHF